MTEGSLAEADFTFTSAVDPTIRWRVAQFHVHEALSEPYEAVIDLAESGRTDLSALLGHPAALVVTRGALHRRLCGVVHAVEDFGTTPTRRHVRAHLVPALWLLQQRKDSRIFQDLTALEVVREVLHVAQVYQGEGELIDGDLDPTAFARRECCVQYQETDLAFITRLLEDEGVTYYFRHDGPREAMVLAWDASTDAFCRQVPTAQDAPVQVMGDGGSTHSAETVRRLEMALSLQPTGVTLREWDFTRPFDDAAPSPGREMGMTHAHPRDVGPRSMYEHPAHATLTDYDVSARHYRRDDLARRAALRFNEYDARRAVGRGEGVVTGCMPGLRLSLVNEDGEHLGPFVLTSVEHTGRAAEHPDEVDPPRGEDRYANAFEFIPVDKVFRPLRQAPRPQVNGPQTATVMAAPGDSDEVCVDAYGRVLLRFHWERPERRSASQQAKPASCWVRVAQSWAGDGWGVVFHPRVGMEVVVQFLDGNPDRPMVTGCVYNRHNPPPPDGEVVERRTRSTIRTSSSPGGGGYNELAFEDLAGREEVYLRAQRDLRAEVGHDRHATVSRDETLRVGGDQRESIEGGRAVRVARDDAREVLGAVDERVHKDRVRRVDGDEGVTVAGNAERAVHRDETTRVGGRARREIAGVVEEALLDDDITRVRGHRAVLVGRHDAPRSAVLHVEGAAAVWSRQTTEVVSAQDIVLRCGKSMIRLTPERVEIVSPEVIVRGGENRVTVGGDAVRIRAKREAVIGAETVTVKSQGAAVKLDANARVMGAKVALGAGSIPLDHDPDSPTRPTTIELVDDAGAPVPHARYVVVMPDGSEQTGFLDHEGKAVVELDARAEVMFPEVPDIEEA